MTWGRRVTRLLEKVNQGRHPSETLVVVISFSLHPSRWNEQSYDRQPLRQSLHGSSSLAITLEGQHQRLSFQRADVLPEQLTKPIGSRQTCRAVRVSADIETASAARLVDHPVHIAPHPEQIVWMRLFATDHAGPFGHQLIQVRRSARASPRPVLGGRTWLPGLPRRPVLRTGCRSSTR